MDVENLLDEARASISDYCLNECRGYCCRKGYLRLSGEEAAFFFSVTKVRVCRDALGEHIFYLGDGDRPCPFLDHDRCSIHTDDRRPLVCRQFPIFLRDGKQVRFSTRCPAVRENKFYGYMYQLRQRGYRIV